MIKLADISTCGNYRYALARIWDESKSLIMFVMLNPSKADEGQENTIIRRFIGFESS
jgi:hypothetical protein